MYNVDLMHEVLEAVKRTPGRRARYLDVHAWVCDVSMALHKLESMGFVRHETAGQTCDEKYDIWFPIKMGNHFFNLIS